MLEYSLSLRTLKRLHVFPLSTSGNVTSAKLLILLINLLSLTFIEVTHTNKFIILQNEWSLE